MNPPAESEAPPLSVAFDYTPDELERTRRVWAERGLGLWDAWLLRHWTKVLFGVLLGLLLLARMWAGVVILTFVASFGMRGAIGRTARMAPAEAAKARTRGLAGMFEVHIGEDALLLRAPTTDLTVPWRCISVEERDGDVVLALPTTTIAIPARAFSDPTDRDRFVAALYARIAAPPDLLTPPAAPGSLPYAPNRGDYRAAGLEALRSGPMLLLIGLLVTGHVVVVLAFLFVPDPLPTLPRLMLPLKSLFLWTAVLVGPTLITTELVARGATRQSTSPGTVHIGADALTFGGAYGNATVPWTVVNAMFVRSRGLVLMTGPMNYVIPRRAFQAESAFRAFVEDAERRWRAGRGY